MADKKKKMSSKKFMAIFIPITAVLLVTAIVITGVMQYWSTVMDAVFGEAQMSVTSAEGTENWDTDYYGLNEDGMTPEDTAAQGAELARRAEAEGIVLLKNQNNALPLTNNGEALSEDNQIIVNALGWSFYYPSTGGSGSGAVGSDGLVSPKEALAAANIQINEGLESYYIDWSNEHYTEWMVTKENGYYGDEDTNTEPARPSVSKAFQAAWDVPELNSQLVAEACDISDAAANNTQIVWIGRGGGEYHDCPTIMTKEGGSVNAYGVNPDKHYLELTDEEEAVLDKAKELRGEDGKVIVVINANNTMELGELEELKADGQVHGDCGCQDQKRPSPQPVGNRHHDVDDKILQWRISEVTYIMILTLNSQISMIQRSNIQMRMEVHQRDRLCSSVMRKEYT